LFLRSGKDATFVLGFSLVVSASSFGIGFRATYRKSNASKLLVLASLNLGLSENAKVQLFPLAYLDMDMCPNVSLPSDKSTTYSNGVRRSQFYLECWSIHKASNITSMWSYSRIGQNLKAATSASQKDQCATLNTSVPECWIPAKTSTSLSNYRQKREVLGLKLLSSPLWSCKMITLLCAAFDFQKTLNFAGCTFNRMCDLITARQLSGLES
jgi:hypothetical protein